MGSCSFVRLAVGQRSDSFKLCKASYKQVCIVPLCSKGHEGKGFRVRKAKLNKRLPRKMQWNGNESSLFQAGTSKGTLFLPKATVQEDQVKTRSQAQPTLRPTTAGNSCPAWLQCAYSAGFHLFSVKLSEGWQRYFIHYLLKFIMKERAPSQYPPAPTPQNPRARNIPLLQRMRWARAVTVLKRQLQSMTQKSNLSPIQTPPSWL